jgi:hypothetical protein
MYDIVALKAMLEYDNYVKYSPALFKLDNLQREHSLVLESVKSYYEKYKDKKTISIDELEAYFYFLNPMVKKDSFVVLFSQLKQTDIDNSVLVGDVLNKVVEIHSCSKIAQVATSVVNGQIAEGIEDIESIISKFKDTVGEMVNPRENLCNDSLEDLLEMDKEGGVRWSLKFLNDTLGPLQLRTLGHIFARPDGGKTSLALNMVAYMAYQMKKMDKELLYMNNEEDIRIVKRRLYSAMLGWDKAYIERHRKEAEELFKAKGGDNIMLVGGVNHIRKVEHYIHVLKPHIAIIDQGPKVAFPGDCNEVERKQRLFNKYREIAKDYNCAFVSLGQADNAADGKRWLHLGNLDGSKVGIPGELDWCLGIGKSNDHGYEFIRYLSIAKNKLTGIYGRGEVKFDPAKCRYEDA